MPTAVEEKLKELEQAIAEIKNQRLEFPIDSVSQSILKTWLDENLSIKVFNKQFNFSDFSTAGTGKDIVLFELDPNAEIISAWFEVLTAFAGGAISAYTISMGPAGAETTLQTAQSVASTGLKLVIGTDFTTNRAVFSTSAKTDIEARATSTDANLDQATAGIANFYALYIKYGKK